MPVEPLVSNTPPFSTPSSDLTNISNEFALSFRSPFENIISPHTHTTKISYYNPDESDGVEKLIQASILLAKSEPKNILYESQIESKEKNTKKGAAKKLSFRDHGEHKCSDDA